MILGKGWLVLLIPASNIATHTHKATLLTVDSCYPDNHPFLMPEPAEKPPLQHVSTPESLSSLAQECMTVCELTHLPLGR